MFLLPPILASQPARFYPCAHAHTCTRTPVRACMHAYSFSPPPSLSVRPWKYSPSCLWSWNEHQLHHPCLGGSSGSSFHPHFHQPTCSPSPLSTPFPPQSPSLLTSVQWVHKHELGLCLLSSWGCAELSGSLSFLFPTSWVVLGPHLRVRKGRKTQIVGEGREFLSSQVTHSHSGVSL